MQVIDGKLESRLHRSSTFGKRLIQALSMAFVLESSDRAKAYVMAALEYLASDCARKKELLGQLQRIEAIYTKYDTVVKDKDFREKRLKKLQAIISHLQGENAA